MSDGAVTCIEQTWGIIQQALTEAGLAGPPTNGLADSFPEQVAKAIVARLSNHDPPILPAYASELRELERAQAAEEELRDLLRAIVVPGIADVPPLAGVCPVCSRDGGHEGGCAWAEARRVLERDGVELDG